MLAVAVKTDVWNHVLATRRTDKYGLFILWGTTVLQTFMVDIYLYREHILRL